MNAHNSTVLAYEKYSKNFENELFKLEDIHMVKSIFHHSEILTRS